MKLFSYINFPIFIASLILGLLAVYFTTSDNKIVYVYPTPENVQHIQYRDKADNCFSIKENEVSCPANEKDIQKIPVQQ
jgi:hypothetical protein